MISRLTLTALALTAGATAASSSSFSSNTHTGPTSTSTVLSFAYPAQAYYASAYTPTEGISAQVYAVDESSRTTLAFTCPSSQSTTGALCPQETNTPVAVTVGPDYFAWNWYRSYDSAYFAPQTTLASDARVEGELHCAVTSTKTKASPVCTVNVTSIAAPLQTAAVMEDMRCFEEDIAGPASELAQGVYNTLSVGSCKSSMEAKPTTAYKVTRNASNVVYWTVTVTEVAAGVTLAPSSGAAGSFGASLSAAAVVGLAAVVLAL
ncbi:hypothetical protein SLS57_002611 [Botryosphaeria dothidea]